jgi:hypothetical protein
MQLIGCMGGTPPYSVKKFILFVELRATFRRKFVLRLNLAVDISKKMTYGTTAGGCVRFDRKYLTGQRVFASQVSRASRDSESAS